MTFTVYHSITEQTNVIYLFYTIKSRKNVPSKVLYLVWWNDFRTLLVIVIIIYTIERTLLTAENSEMGLIDLSLKWHKLCVCPLIDQGSLGQWKPKLNSTKYKGKNCTIFYSLGSVFLSFRKKAKALWFTTLPQWSLLYKHRNIIFMQVLPWIYWRALRQRYIK